jgi:tRNA dimethylallyltransferase
VNGTFFIVGPTATGKSEIAAQVAARLNAEIVSADAFQIYRGLDLLTAKPEPRILARAPHHLLGTVPLTEQMNVAKFRGAAMRAIHDIHERGKLTMVVGGSGLYVKALTHGLAVLPEAHPELRETLNRAPIEELFARLSELDPAGAKQIDHRNKRRLVRALEVCVLSGKPFSAHRTEWHAVEAAVPSGTAVSAAETRHGGPASATTGIFVFRERAELYDRINRRVERMFAEGVVEEVRAAGEIGATAEKMLGWREIRALIAGQMSEPACRAAIQQGTRHYAKRQLTWFQRQTNFEPLNLSLHASPEAIELIAQNVSRVCANG